MSAGKPQRVMWMLNHTTLMPFEMKVLMSLGFEVFVPKVLPGGMNSRTAVATYEYDDSLSIPAEDLQVLNSINFYDEIPSRDVMKIVNRHFGTLIVPYIFPGAYYVTRMFKGSVVLRLFGHEERFNYQTCTDHIGLPINWRFDVTGKFSERWRNWKDAYLLKKSREKLVVHNEVMLSFYEMRKRLHFGAAYKPVIENEPPFFKMRSAYLPLGIPDSIMQHANQHQGGNGKLAFVCPNINDLFYYRREYEIFKKHFAHIPHEIGGKQNMGGGNILEPLTDPCILGYQSRDEFDAWLKQSDCMYYHSVEPRHLHYHPVEGMAIGVPVVFLGGGLLESIGGSEQPGLCRSYEEAAKKVERVLSGDAALIRSIQTSQKKIVDEFSFEYCVAEWRRNFVEGIVEKRYGRHRASPRATNAVAAQVAASPARRAA